MKFKISFRLVLLFIQSHLFIFCHSNTDQEIYSYKELLEIYSITQYFGNHDQIFELIIKKYDFMDTKNQIKYDQSLNFILNSKKPQEKWNLFIKDSIDYYINMIKNFKVKYYQNKAYNVNLNQFNHNFSLEKNNITNYPSYWKVYYYSFSENSALDNKQTIFIQEFYQNNQIISRKYYDQNLNYKIKEEIFENNHLILKKYYHDENKISF